jgi:hypothetical protein
MRPVQEADPDREAAGCHLLLHGVPDEGEAHTAGKALPMVRHGLHAQEGQQHVLLPVMRRAGARNQQPSTKRHSHSVTAERLEIGQIHFYGFAVLFAYRRFAFGRHEPHDLAVRQVNEIALLELRLFHHSPHAMTRTEIRI